MRSALANVPEIKNLDTKPAATGGTCTFEVAKGFDFSAKLNEFADGGNEHIAGWKEAN